ncbi:hypothetical protein GCM10011492_03520 [Flexivirga endophytica]|uniref:Metal-dependent phosphohydrolase n=1 Tax=Flexivirga endophytica TaxID=1849103 RepID=A0A916WMR6_9MICO|nr:metal-dependent phosphohydrolase [Flexivirga endophytica]GGB17042.1 hypothetical protein GCM10011492_03520 [Flexivirga endophytica]GHB38525.1 hypothetical protein GCM10008112_04090 [Flexivirga endophytica]
MPDAELLDTWIADVAALAPTADREQVRREGSALLARWSEPHRSYHTAQHLREMLSAVDRLGATAGVAERDRRVAHVAAWLHDAVYDVQAPPGDSERESAQLARDLLASFGVDGNAIRTVVELILLTIEHGTDVPGPLADAFTDADLAILAAPAGRFDEYCAQVRAEYAHVPDAAYATGRSDILTVFVDRAEVYRTAFARDAWTAAARANIRREIDRLAR